MSGKAALRPAGQDPAEQDLLPIARVLAPHGLNGQLKVKLYNEGSDLLEQLERVFLLDAVNGRKSEHEVLGVRATPQGTLVRLARLTDRTLAEQYIRWELAVPRDWLPEPEEDEYYYHQLIGLEATDCRGRVLGQVTGLFDNGASEILVIRDGERELLVPFVDEVVVEVDLERRVLLLDPMEGLLEP